MIGFVPLASGSKGNCIYLGTPQTKILIDAGLSGRAIKLKLAEIGVAIEEIDAVLITHEHTDHIQGLRILAYRMGLPILTNKGTATGIINHFGDGPHFKLFTTGESFQFCGLEIHPFSIQHDTNDPVAFTIKLDTFDLKLGFCTDLGFVTSLVRAQLRDCDYLYLEANHQPSMVHACPRPMTYKQRVLGRSGHLSNEAAGELLAEINHPGLKHVHLAHLSEECNNPHVALEVVRNKLQEASYRPEISVAHQKIISRAIHFQPKLATVSSNPT